MVGGTPIYLFRQRFSPWTPPKGSGTLGLRRVGIVPISGDSQAPDAPSHRWGVSMRNTALWVIDCMVVTALVVNCYLVVVNWRLMVASKRLHTMLMILANNAWTMRGWPLHEMLEYGVRRREAEQRRRG